MAYKPASYALRRCIVILALCLFFLVPTLNAGTSSGQVAVIRLAGGDWGYPSPYAPIPGG